MMIFTDTTEIPLMPGNLGKDCLYNGEHDDVECCCDECDYLMCCMDGRYPKNCFSCNDEKCPRKD